MGRYQQGRAKDHRHCKLLADVSRCLFDVCNMQGPPGHLHLHAKAVSFLSTI
jgi:hypothetical protein